MLRLVALAALLGIGMPAASQDCGPEEPCRLDGGSYYLRLPDTAGPHPVVIWYHGHRGNGASIHRPGGLERAFLDRGYALIAPNGYRVADGFRIYPAREDAPRDDVDFTFTVLQHAGTRAELDLEAVFAMGFSAGGSMAWLLACEAGDRLDGLVSVAGALRRPNTTDCAGLSGLPVMQIHGFGDAQVPFEGRAIRDWHQGSIWEALGRARTANGCRSNPDAIEIGEDRRSCLWDASCDRAPVMLELHDGGHGLPEGWADRARQFLEGARQP